MTDLDGDESQGQEKRPCDGRHEERPSPGGSRVGSRHEVGAAPQADPSDFVISKSQQSPQSGI